MFNISERLLLTLWIGGMWTVGYIVTPTLFHMLDDRMVAGRIAGQLFTILAYIGLLSGTVLLLAQWFRSGGNKLQNWRLWVLLVMLLIVAVGQFVIQPMMVELKAAGLVPGSHAAASFGRLHGISSILFMVNSLLGLVLVIVGLGGRSRANPGC